MSDDDQMIRNITVGRLREIIREEISLWAQPVWPLPSLPVGKGYLSGFACACGPNQCARLQSGGMACAHFRQQDY